MKTFHTGHYIRGPTEFLYTKATKQPVIADWTSKRSPGDRPTDRPTDGPTDGPTDRQMDRVYEPGVETETVFYLTEDADG